MTHSSISQFSITIMKQLRLGHLQRCYLIHSFRDSRAWRWLWLSSGEDSRFRDIVALDKKGGTQVQRLNYSRSYS
jgi:hypothetical protein